MPHIRRGRAELDRPEWFPRRFFDWPEPWRDLLAEEGMRVEEFQEGDTLVVRVEMPGLDPDKDVEITVSDATLRIKAERRQETKTEDKLGYRSEFRYGSFVRSVALPAGADPGQVKAAYNDGILEVRVTVSPEAAQARKIPIARG